MGEPIRLPIRLWIVVPLDVDDVFSADVWVLDHIEALHETLRMTADRKMLWAQLDLVDEETDRNPQWQLSLVNGQPRFGR